MIRKGDMIFKNGNVGVIRSIKKEHILPEKSFWTVEWDSGVRSVYNEAILEKWKEAF
jgi:hypothetical protein